MEMVFVVVGSFFLCLIILAIFESKHGSLGWIGISLVSTITALFPCLNFLPEWVGSENFIFVIFTIIIMACVNYFGDFENNFAAGMRLFACMMVVAASQLYMIEKFPRKVDDKYPKDFIVVEPDGEGGYRTLTKKELELPVTKEQQPKRVRIKKALRKNL